MATTSLTSARDYFEEVLKPSYDQYFAATSSFKNIHAMTTALFHFHEWLWHYNKTELVTKYGAHIKTYGDFWHQIVQVQVTDAGLIRDLTNASKHVEIDRNQSTAMHHSANTHIVVIGGISETQLSENNRMPSLDPIATELFQFWKTLIDEIAPPAPPVVPVSSPPTSNS